MKKYTLGFAFDAEAKNVLLIQMGPDSLFPGHWNGLGGKPKPEDDGPENTMQREFQEESGMDIPAERWESTITLTVVAKDDSSVVAKVGCYRATLTTEEMVTASKTKDCAVFPVGQLPKAIVPNLSWLVPMHAFAEVYYGAIHERQQPFHALAVAAAQEPQEPQEPA